LDNDLLLSYNNNIPIEKRDIDLAADVKLRSDNALATLNNLLQYDQLGDGPQLLL